MNIKLKTSDNFKLDADFYPGTSGKGIIFAHGMTVPRQDEEPFLIAAEKLNKLGFSTLLFDFRAHGKSQGNPKKDFTISNELIDLQAAFDFMKSQLLALQGETLQDKEAWVGLAGASFGGGISALFAGEHSNNIKKLVLAYPTLDYKIDVFSGNTPWVKQYFTNAYERAKKDGFIFVGSRNFPLPYKIFQEMKNFKPIEALKNYKNPILLLHGDKDDAINIKSTKKLIEPIKNAKFKIIQGGEHGLSEEPYASQAANLITSFFSE